MFVYPTKIQFLHKIQNTKYIVLRILGMWNWDLDFGASVVNSLVKIKTTDDKQTTFVLVSI